MKRQNVETSKRQGATRRSSRFARTAATPDFDVLTFRRFDVSLARGAAFTLIEMLVALTVIAAVAAVVVPLMSDQSRLRVTAAAGVISSDIELAQVMTIAHPDEPVVVRFDPDGSRYWLAFAGDPETPIAREDTGEDYMVIFGAGRARGALGVTLTVEDLPGDALTFAAHGGLSDFTISPRIKIANGTRGIQLAITPNTGSITESEFTPEPRGDAEAIGGGG